MRHLNSSTWFTSKFQFAERSRELWRVGYLDFLCLMNHATFVMTDSCGIQEESTVLGVPCLTLRENTERPVTISEGTNQLVGTDSVKIRAAVSGLLSAGKMGQRVPPFWDGHAAERIVGELLKKTATIS